MEEFKFRLNDGDLEIFVDDEWKYCSSGDNNIRDIVDDVLGMIGLDTRWCKSV